MIQPIIWILVLNAMLSPLVGQTDFRWLDVTPELGLASPDRLPFSGRYHLPEAFRGRAVPFDFDRDGDLDLLFTYGPHVADSLYVGLNRLYRQDDTAWVEVTAETGLTHFPPAGNAAVGDVDGDGYLDLYLCMYGTDRLLHNEGGRRWRDVTVAAGLANDYWSTEAVFFDANRDGYLDLYVANYLDYPSGDTLVCFDPETRRRTFCDPQLYEPAPNRLFVGDSSGRFREMTAALGLADTSSRSLAVKLLDANSDGYLDLFVLSYCSPNLLYLGAADTGFVEAGLFAGVALAPDGSEREWSQVLTLDANQDGHPDLLFISQDRQMLLMLNDGRGLFFEGHYQTGLFQPRFPYQATTAAAVDLDFSGTVDLLLADASYEHVREPAAVYTSAVGTAAVDTAVVDAVAVDSADVVQDSSLVSAWGAPVDSAVTEPVVEATALQRRILLSDEEHRFRAVEMAAPMLLDTTLLVPRVTAAAPDAAFFGLPMARFDLPGYVGLDTLPVLQEAERYLVVDLTGDGVEEVIATYPAGLVRVWKRELDEQPVYVGLWPGADQPGTTAIGAQLLVTSSPAGIFTGRYLVTDPRPFSLYLSSKVRAVDVVVKWPDGFESHHHLTPLNRTYPLTRVELEP
ncbi:MAG: FG-GAP repeat domain-containing protein [Candidatus Neomarinimicrobiota bacterium]